MSKQKISVIGLGKLGSPLAAIFAAKGFPTLGLDIYKPFVDAINQGKAPVVEPLLQEYLDKGRKNLRATQDYSEAIRDSDITFLIVQTPSREDGSFSDEYLKQALKELALALKQSGKPWHNFVIVSTVSPGTINNSLIPWIEQYSGRKFNEGFGIAYNPEFIALGDVINGLIKPDMVLIGEGNKEIGDQLEKMYREDICENDAYIARMSIISAEIAKISLNVYVTTKISFANMLANICERVPGADVDDITRALGADKRISPHYLKAGPAFSGPCFPRDGRAFIAFARKCGVNAKLTKATYDINDLQMPLLVEKVLAHTKRKVGPGTPVLASADYAGGNPVNRVAILGLAYKPNTPVIEESPAIKLIDALLKEDVEVVAYDPLAMENTRAVFGDKVLYANSAKDALKHCALAIITTREKEFIELGEADIIHNPTTIIDCWRIVEHLKTSSKVRYVAVGKYNI